MRTSHFSRTATEAGRRRRPLRLASALAALAAALLLGAAGGRTGVLVDAATGAQLTGISARAGGGVTSVLIEASEPVAYVATRPDPLTLLVDLRHVSASGAVNRVPATPGGLLDAVTVEEARAPDGATLARVRLKLATPARHSVRSSRNVIQVDLDRQSGAASKPAPTAPPVPAAPPQAPATVIRSVQSVADGGVTRITLAGDGKLQATTTEMAKDQPPRLVLDFAGVTSKAPAVTAVGIGPVQRVRVAVHSAQPLVTRVVFDLSREATYEVLAGTTPQELVVLFDGGAKAAAVAPKKTEQPPPPPPPKPKVQEPVRQEPKPVEPAKPPAPKPEQVPPPPPPLPPPMPSPAQSAQIGSGAQKQFTGHPVSFDFQNTDLRTVLRAFAEISGLNIVIDPKVDGSVDVTLRDVPWDQALEIILRSNKLGYVVDGTIVRIAPLTVLADEEKDRRKLAEEQALSGELKLLTKTLSYAQATDLEPLLKGNVLSNRGTTAVDKRTNTLIIADLPVNLQKVESLLAALDQPEGQVEIEARIVQTSKRFARELGIQWGFQGAAAPELGNTTGLTFPNSATFGTAGGVKVLNPTGVAQLALGSINGALQLDVSLSALERENKIKILLTPRVVVQNNTKGIVTRGQEIPYTTTIPPATGGGGVIVSTPIPTVQFKTAALRLEVTPRITAAGTVLLEVDVDNGSPGEKQDNGNVAINTQRAQTRVLVKDGGTTVIGGIYGTNEVRRDDRVPGVYRIPLLGWLFKNNQTTLEDEELLIFITPRILKTQ